MIEVLLAMAIFAVAAVMAIIAMNSGMAMAQRSLETTLARQQMDSQADMIRMTHDAFVDDPNSTLGRRWADILANNLAGTPSTLASLETSTGECINGGDIPKAFALFADNSGAIQKLSGTTQLAQAPVFARIQPNSTYTSAIAQGLWIEIVSAESSPGAPRAYDVHLRACWSGVASKNPIIIGTIVRVYEPNS